jgi:uncharacterized protein YciI
MPIFAVTYEYKADSDPQRDEVRAVHREWLRDQATLLLSGPTDDRGAVLFFEGDSASAVGELLDQDPFAIAGVIEKRHVAGWTPVSGRWREQLGL